MLRDMAPFLAMDSTLTPLVRRYTMFLCKTWIVMEYEFSALSFRGQRLPSPALSRSSFLQSTGSPEFFSRRTINNRSAKFRTPELAPRLGVLHYYGCGVPLLGLFTPDGWCILSSVRSFFYAPCCRSNLHNACYSAQLIRLY